MVSCTSQVTAPILQLAGRIGGAAIILSSVSNCLDRASGFTFLEPGRYEMEKLKRPQKIVTSGLVEHLGSLRYVDKLNFCGQSKQQKAAQCLPTDVTTPPRRVSLLAALCLPHHNFSQPG